MKRYNPKEIEPKWQKIWQDTKVYEADLDSSKPKYMAMSMFNYPSGAGLHIGHAMNYTISDIKARFKRQQGYESYHPVGWDAFGLPAENYAIKVGVSPQASMAKIIPNYHKQYKAMGWSNDWSKEIATHQPEYYKWTQWIFSQMYKYGLAYQDSRMQWWCTKCQTVLANEQIINGKCWRHDGIDDLIIEKKEVKQWFFKITEYADELLEGIDDLDWTESVKLAQKNWIGRSSGAEVDFELENKNKITVFTTRPDTLFGATFLVLAPEHELVESLTTNEKRGAVKSYINQALLKSEVERQENKNKTGVFTGSYAINPVSGEKIPIWIADYVLTGYGTGAIMAVPAHDERDNEFAKKYNLDITSVVAEDFGIKLENTVDVEGVVVVGYDPKTKKYMSLLNKKQNVSWLVSGGREDGETFMDTALRELQEEAGFAEIEDIIQLGEPVYSYFYNDIKQSNRRSFGYNYLVLIDSTNQSRQQLESHEDFEVEWQDYDQLYKNIEKVEGGVEHWLDALSKAKHVIDQGLSEYTVGFTGEGIMINSGEYDGMSSSEAREKIVADLVNKGLAKTKVNYKMRDWSVSRQRYWGAPIPIINCKKCGAVLVTDEDLPVKLPELTDFKPSGDGRSALARAKDWLEVTCPSCGGKAERETDTLDTYICSSWYFLRYIDPHNDKKIFDSVRANKWMPVDFYNGGDHATAHLLYARFVTRFFSKIGLLSNPEPFKQMLFNGKIMAEDGSAFSKSKGNGIDPLEIISQGYGADALRMFLMFAAPLEFDARWNSQGVPATHRFLSRLWNLTQEYHESKSATLDGDVARQILRVVHKMVKTMTVDIEENRYNTAIATAMGALNELYKLKVKHLSKNATWQQALDFMVASIAPFAPHVADELWQQLGHKTSVQKDSWPDWDNNFIEEDNATVVVQINGKLRGKLSVVRGSSEQKILSLIKQDNQIQSQITGEIKKVIFISDKLINLVV